MRTGAAGLARLEPLSVTPAAAKPGYAWVRAARRTSASMQGEIVGVEPGRESRAMLGQTFGGQSHARDLRLRAELDLGLTKEIEHSAAARVEQVVAVDADAVDSDAV